MNNLVTVATWIIVAFFAIAAWPLTLMLFCLFAFLIWRAATYKDPAFEEEEDNDNGS